MVAPLLLVGFFNLWAMWQVSREQLNQSIERQAQLAATAFEQWTQAQTETLATISTLAEKGNQAMPQNYLDSAMQTRPHWLDARIVNAAGETVLAQKIRPPAPPLLTTENDVRESAARKLPVINVEQSAGENPNYISLTLPMTDGNYAVARISGASAGDVFRQLKLPENYIIAVFDSNRRLLYRNNVSPEQMSLDVGSTPLLSALDNRQTATLTVQSPYDQIERVYGLARVNQTNCLVAVGVPDENLYAPLKRQYLRQFWFSLAAALIAVLSALWIARGIVYPLRLLTAAARAFGAGDLNARAKIREGGALQILGESFNEMAAQIRAREGKLKELDRLKSEFVSSVSHELRTPLTTIKTLVRVLQQKKSTPLESEEYLQTIAVECDRQIDFVQSLLELSRIESGAYKVSFAEVNLDKLLSELVETQQRAAESRNLSLIYQTPAAHIPLISTDAGALGRIVSSLIENAMKYTAEPGAIVVAVERQTSEIALSVTDDGCGIAADDLPNIYERYFRGRPLNLSQTDADETAENETPGIGLGLYLVKNLVEQIHGKITAVSPPPDRKSGTRLTITLPL